MSSALSSRQRSVLYAAVSEYIATGEPVGSKTLAKKYAFDLSAATIRNVLSELEANGFLVQPHTSAGRVPTEAAFRLFIDALMKTQQLSPQSASRITSWLDELPLSGDVLRSTGRFLSELTGVPAIVARVPSAERQVLKIRFIPTRPKEVLSVVVFVDGTVENRFIAVDEPLSDRELSRLHELLEVVTTQRSLGEIREHFARTCADGRSELQRLGQTEHQLVEQALATRAVASEVIIEGQTKLLGRDCVTTDNELKGLLYVLEDHELLVTLLDRTLAANEVQVFLGGEISSRSDSSISLIAAPFRASDGDAVGAVGVLGPRRMDYPMVVPLVGATADAIGTALSRVEGGRGSSTELGHVAPGDKK